MRYCKSTIYFATNGASTDKATDKAVSLLGGYTLGEHKGGWESQGIIVEENSYTLTIITPESRSAETTELAMYIKSEYKQSEVWVTEEEIKNTIF
jgi:hypothetical protein